MKKSMKRIYMGLLTVLAVGLLAACGNRVEENAVEGEDAAGGQIVQNTHSTPEMDKENENEKENEANRRQETKDAETELPEQVVLAPEDLNEPEIGEQDVTDAIPERHAVNKLQIVFLGDSILDGYRNETGIAHLTGEYCDADVYNLAMGGTTAALPTGEKAEYEEWTSRSLQGVVHAICGNVDPSIMDGFTAREIFDMCDFSETDYFVLEYGMNDFLSSMPLNNEESVYDPYTYVGALRIAVKNLREYYPDAQIVLCSPNYAHFWASDGTYLGDGNMSSNGIANLVEYHRVCGNVSADLNTLFLNAYEGIGLDAYTADEYLEDGVHLSAKGREAYARKLSQIILECEETRNN